MVALVQNKMTKDEKRIIFAASVGTLLEWYDFFLFGLLVNVMAKNFFTGFPQNIAFVFSLLIFAVGFFSRPFGAVIFGHLGDRLGRKYSFLWSIAIMGVSTFAIGLLPTAQQIGIYAPILLVAIRIIQGLAMGGEYGGAVVYVAEHAPAHRRGEYTGWILTIGTIGTLLALLVIIATRYLMRDAGGDLATRDNAFEQWGWRIPFLVSIALLYVSVRVRLKLNESPLFLQMQQDGKLSRAPFVEVVFKWSNLKYILIGLFALVIPVATVFITGQFYALQFISQTLKLDPLFANEFYALAILSALPFYFLAGWVSDRLGRKWLIIGTSLVCMATFFPMFQALTHYANPGFEAAIKNTPITVMVDKDECHSQFDPVNLKTHTTSCDIAVFQLAKANVPFHYLDGAKGELAKITIGLTEITSYRVIAESEMPRTAAAINRANKQLFEDQIATALNAANYPKAADPAQVNYGMVAVIMCVLAIMGTFAFGSVSASLAELFPTHLRYTGFSLPFHIAACVVNGVFPAAAFALVAKTGGIYDGLWIALALSLSGLAAGSIFLPETRGRRLE